MSRNYLTFLGPNPPVWEIEDDPEPLLSSFIRWIKREPLPQISYHARRIQLLTELLSACERTLLTCPDNPAGLFPQTRQVDARSWELSRGIDAPKLYDFLSTEAWRMVGFHHIDPDIPLPSNAIFQPPGMDFFTLGLRTNAAYLLDAFHDSDPWTITINPNLAEHIDSVG